MRFVLLVVGAATMLFTPAQAQNYPWCAQYSGRALGGAQNCGFVSFAQCMANSLWNWWLLRTEQYVSVASAEGAEKETTVLIVATTAGMADVAPSLWLCPQGLC
jgi:hypothetical protein